jgi:branched-chain amino acid aminotransferase
MFVATWSPETGAWSAGQLQPYGPISMMPSAQVLNYGQSVFEGMKAQHSAKGRVVLFRPDRNAARLQQGAARLSMPPVPEALFVEAVRNTVKSNIGWVSAPPSVNSPGNRPTQPEPHHGLDGCSCRHRVLLSG